MSESYKITRKMALRIVELRNDGLRFWEISEKINSEFKIDIDRSSIGKFYKNFLDGKSRILPKAELELNIKSIPIKAKMDKPRNESSNISNDSKSSLIDEGLTELIANQGLSDGSDFNKAKQPSNDLLGLFKDKPRNK